MRVRCAVVLLFSCIGGNEHGHVAKWGDFCKIASTFSCIIACSVLLKGPEVAHPAGLCRVLVFHFETFAGFVPELVC